MFQAFATYISPYLSLSEVVGRHIIVLLDHRVTIRILGSIEQQLSMLNFT